MKQLKIKAVIFDMDGTIIDTEYIWQKVIYDFLLKRGIKQLTPTQVDKLKNSAGGGLPKASEVLKNEFNFSESIEQLVKEKTALSLEYMEKYQVNFIKGFQSFHKQLQKKLISTSIGTNSNIPTLDILSKKLNLKQFFGNNIYSMEHVENKAKPDPAVFLHAAKKLNVKPSECLVFEDSISGFKAAKKAGMTLVAIKNKDNKDLLNIADYVINDYTDKILENL